jgi:hypothetical protein
VTELVGTKLSTKDSQGTWIGEHGALDAACERALLKFCALDPLPVPACLSDGPAQQGSAMEDP